MLGRLLLVALGALGAVGAPLPHSITVEIVPPDAGVVTGAGLYSPGATVVLKAEPFPGFAFLCWTENETVVSQEPQLFFTATHSRSLTAHFVPVPFFEGVTGDWSGELGLLPGTGLKRMRLHLQSGFLFGRHRWRLGIEARGAASGLTSFATEASVDLTDLRIGGQLYFDPVTVTYRSSSLSFSYRDPTLVFLGTVRHTQGMGLAYTASLRAGPAALTVDFAERMTGGVFFSQAVLRLRELPLCCGVVAAGTLAFTKRGFQYLELSVRDLARLDCCGVFLDGLVRYEVSQKIVQIRSRSRLFDEACFRLYGDVLWDQGTFWGLEIHGFQIRCRVPGTTRGTALDLELVTALDPGRLPWARFQGREFEYWRLGITGPGCCGGKLSSDFTLYFADGTSLFGLSRLLAGITVPCSSGFELSAKLGIDVLASTVQLGLGWSLGF